MFSAIIQVNLCFTNESRNILIIEVSYCMVLFAEKSIFLACRDRSFRVPIGEFINMLNLMCREPSV